MLILLFEFILLEGLKVVLIKTKYKLLQHGKIFFGTWAAYFQCFPEDT